ncbi:hypothetical protein ACFLU3_06025 [Chloroflexota bacterium]
MSQGLILHDRFFLPMSVSDFCVLDEFGTEFGRYIREYFGKRSKRRDIPDLN